ncbi:catalase family protein [Rhodoblastus acidophilus]|nr:catalase family protein [Rhodoblastus acidophilus]
MSVYSSVVWRGQDFGYAVTRSEKDAMRDGYLRFEPSIEQSRPDEPEIIKTIVESIGRTNVSSFAKWHRAIRQQHAKGHGFLRGELKIYDDLPDHLRQGMFATPRSYPIIVRLSTAFGDIRSDRIRVPRGMAIKVLGVKGPKALPDDYSSNQDFLLVNHKSYFSDAADYLSAQRIFEWQPTLPDFVLRALGLVSRGWVKLGVRSRWPILQLANALGDGGNNILGEAFYSEGALRYGDYVARLSASPVSESVLTLTGRPCNKDDNALLSSVVEFFSKNEAEYELRAQLCTDLQRTPIEDASIDWPEEVSPYQPVAKIVLPPQAADNPARRAYADDSLSFSPWRCLADHQPLGSIMRLRKEAYSASAAFRQSETPITEPQSISEFPD